MTEHNHFITQSILFPNWHSPRPQQPDFFSDLNLDQIIAAITSPKKEHKLEPFFYLPLRHEDDIRFRQEVMQDLDDPAVFAAIGRFAESMRDMRRSLAYTGN